MRARPRIRSPAASPFHVLVGESARFSGNPPGTDWDSVRLGVGWQSGEVTLPRACVQAIVQRPGEARVLADGFEALDASRWSIGGKAESVAEPHLSEKRSLRLPADGASVVHNLEEPLAAGRLDLAFFDDGVIAAGRERIVEATFRGPAGLTAMRIILGCSEESLAVESPSGLQIQRLARARGWHRLLLRFGPDQTEIAVDGKELAHGRGPGGPLVTIRLATQDSGPAPPATPMAAHFDDLQLTRFAEPPASLEVDAGQDEARLVVGDQLYGEIRGADPRRVIMGVDDKSVSLPWGEVSGLYLRRMPIHGIPIEGLLVRAQWRSAPGDRPTDLDFAEGALLAQSPISLTLATPYAGTLTIPRGDLRRIVVLGQGRRLVIDTSAHHLGDEISVTPPLLDPPQPEGLTLERTIELTGPPPDDRPADLAARRRPGRPRGRRFRLLPASPQRRAPHLCLHQWPSGRLPESLHQGLVDRCTRTDPDPDPARRAACRQERAADRSHWGRQGFRRPGNPPDRPGVPALELLMLGLSTPHTGRPRGPLLLPRQGIFARWLILDVIGNKVFGIRNTDFFAMTAMQTTGRPYSRSRLMGPRPAKASSLACRIEGLSVPCAGPFVGLRSAKDPFLRGAKADNRRYRESGLRHQKHRFLRENRDANHWKTLFPITL